MRPQRATALYATVLSTVLMVITASPCSAGTTVRIPTFIVVPGQKPNLDNVCLGPGAEVGQSKAGINGDRMLVTKIVGKSAMCKDKNTPLLAEVDLVPAENFQSTLSVELPTGFVTEPLTNKDRFDGARLKGTSKDRLIAFFVYGYNRKNTISFEKYAQIVRESQLKWNKALQTPVENLTIHGLAAQRWETTFTPPGLFAKERTHMTTLINGDKELAYVNVLVTSFRLPEERSKLQSLAESVRGLSDAEPAAEGVAPESIQSTDPKPPVD